jgi:ABC-type polysaccharide/polyol phosphate transport system ATPase subunit
LVASPPHRHHPSQLREAELSVATGEFVGLIGANGSGHPGMDNLAAIFTVMRSKLGVNIEVHAVPVA